MKYSVTTFKSLKKCLQELEPFIRDGNHLETGKPFKRFEGLRSREILGLWLLCAVIEINYKQDRFKICTDPQGGDGIIYDTEDKKAWPVEQILVSRSNKEKLDIQSAILKHIEKKQKKGGAAYASGKILIVFLNKVGGGWHPNKVGRSLPKKLDFTSVWVVGLQNVINDEYNYNVTRLNPNGCPVWQVHINKTFDDWRITKIQ